MNASRITLVTAVTDIGKRTTVTPRKLRNRCNWRNSKWRKRRKLIERYDRENLQTARIIAADPVKYASGALEWAQAVLKRPDGHRDAQAGPRPLNVQYEVHVHCSFVLYFWTSIALDSGG